MDIEEVCELYRTVKARTGADNTAASQLVLAFFVGCSAESVQSSTVEGALGEFAEAIKFAEFDPGYTENGLNEIAAAIREQKKAS